MLMVGPPAVTSAFTGELLPSVRCAGPLCGLWLHLKTCENLWELVKTCENSEELSGTRGVGGDFDGRLAHTRLARSSSDGWVTTEKNSVCGPACTPAPCLWERRSSFWFQYACLWACVYIVPPFLSRLPWWRVILLLKCKLTRRGVHCFLSIVGPFQETLEEIMRILQTGRSVYFPNVYVCCLKALSMLHPLFTD